MLITQKENFVKNHFFALFCKTTKCLNRKKVKTTYPKKVVFETNFFFSSRKYSICTHYSQASPYGTLHLTVSVFDKNGRKKPAGRVKK